MPTPLQSLAAALADRYQIERELGRGGMATVFLAEDLKHGRRVAIKMMHPELAAAIGHDRFLREIEIAARLTHPHILPLHDSGAADRRLYYVMPFIEGESLRARIEREKQLSLEDALRLTREIASALGHAHHRGLVHRDVKPENVLLSDGIAIVADFGIARAVSAIDAAGTTPTVSTGAAGDLTVIGNVIGTPSYMAPEQAMGSPDVDARADLYALGCVLYEMLAGRPPFTGPVESLAYQHMSVEPQPVTEFRPDVPAGIVAVLAKALAKAPADRFATAARFAEALGVAAVETPAPTGKAAATVPNNLPRDRTSFVGREGELAECARLLGQTRLLTLFGVGGCGKTRLAVKLAENLLETHPDGAWFVDLAPVPSPERVPQSVATALGVKEEPGEPMTATLARRFEGKRALLVLDNCEHLLSACAELTDSLLSSCPALRIVATSREALGVEGERSYAVRSLSVPGPEARERWEEIENIESVQLFVARARMVAPDFTLGEETARGVAEICRRLDGIPLALELAAARTKLLSLEQICAMLDDRFRLLTGGSKALPRHQTLRETIQWSYDHLTVEMQGLFDALAVFDGGWTLAAATAVMGEDVDEFHVLDLMTGLVDKSLVLVGHGSPLPRYRMLETIKQFAQERLRASGCGDQVRGRHLDHYLAFVEEAESNLYGSEQEKWFRRIDQELENVLVAHGWCDRVDGGAEMGLRLAGGLPRYWITRGLFTLGMRTTRQALARGASGTATRARARALFSGGALATRMGDQDAARAFLEESVPMCRAVGDESGASRGLSFLGVAMFAQGDRQAAHRCLEEAVEIAQGIDKATALNGLASILVVEGDHRRACALYEQALALARGLKSTTQTAATLGNLALARVLCKEYAAARANLLEAFELSERAALVASRQGVMEITSMLAAALDDPQRAARLWGAAEAALERMGTHRLSLIEQVLQPQIARARDSLGEAAFAAAVAEGRALSDAAATAEARAWLERADTNHGAAAPSVRGTSDPG